MTAIQPIDKPFLEEVLGQPVLDFVVSEGCKAGDNVAGSLKSITATTEDNQQHHFVFKRFPEKMTQENSFVVFMKAFWREHAVYKTILPRLEKFAKSKGLEYTAPAPKYYKGYNDDIHDYLLLEDVRPAGYKMPDKMKSLTLDEVTLTLKEFAKFHAIGFSFLRHEGDRVFQEIEGFQYLTFAEGEREMMMEGFFQMISLFYNVSADILEQRFPEGAKLMRKYKEHRGKIDFTLEGLTDKSTFPVICHFDLWCNNMLIKHDESGRPVGVKFIDFQFPQRGNIFSDLSYFLFTSTAPEFRKAHLNTVLNIYYEEFCNTLEVMKVPVPWGFTKGFFIDTFESGMGSAFAWMTFAIPLQLGMITQTDKEKDAEDEMQLGHTDKGIRKMYEESPRAIDRLEALAREMIERKIFK